MSGAATSVVVGGTLVAINSQQNVTPTQDNTETTSKPTPKVKSGILSFSCLRSLRLPQFRF